MIDRPHAEVYDLWGLAAEDLLLAVVGETLRWRGGPPDTKVNQDTEKEMKLMELAFRMGQSSLPSSSSHGLSSTSARPKAPLLALTDGKVEQVAEADLWMLFLHV